MNSRAVIVCVTIFLLSLILGLSWRIYSYNYSRFLKKECGTLKGFILNHPYVNGGKQVIVLKDKKVITGMYPSYRVGEYIIVDVKDCTLGRKIFYYPKIIKDETVGIRFLTKISNRREALIKRIQKQLPEPHASLVLGMTIGYRGDYPSDLYNLLIKTGTVHVIVVSGYNVSLVLSFVSVFFLRFGAKIFVLFSFTFLILFLILVGLEAPLLRALIMGILGMVAFVSGETEKTLYILFLSFVFMVFIDPSYLFDIGFQLSFTATLLLIVVSAGITQRSNLMTDFLGIVAVNAGIIPIISYYFGKVSLLSIPVNLAIAWIVPFITVGGFLYFVFPIYALKIVLIVFVDYFLSAIRFFENIGFGVFDISFNVPQIIIYYALLMIVFKLIFAWKSNNE